MQAGKSVVYYACFLCHCCRQSDADHAYVQVWLKLTETWIDLPREALSSEWFDDDGRPLYEQPVIRLLRALYGHPGAGTFSEQHCDNTCVKQIGFEPVDTWHSCHYHSQWQLRLTVYVHDVKMSGPKKPMDLAWKEPQEHLEIE